MVLRSLLCLLTGIITLATANVEKTIFLGPEPVNIPQQSPTLSDLHIDVLTPANYSLRTHVAAIFSTSELPKGTETWLVLDSLTEGQRYEVRICWLATQPTAFHLETYPLDTVFATPDLITSLYNYSMSRQSTPPSPPRPSLASNIGADNADHLSSVLFLRISAAADYFTVNETLMRHPEPVLVDIILDPFLANLLPRTLLPTVGYVVVVAAVAGVLATQGVMPWLRGLMVEDADGPKEGEKKSQ